ncbi:uncharacterized protein [Dysidea avara]|uniref:uncharacterized protein isoform X2 n=1 Tax=Dysidea avara TaxID=196820 RepID=UPI0033345AF0
MSADAYPPSQYPQQSYPVQQYQDPNAGLQYYPPQDANFAAPNQMPYPTQPPPYDFEKEKGVYPLAQTQAVHMVVQEQPRTIVVASYPGAVSQSFLVLSIVCVVLSVLCSWPSLICSIPALICSVVSNDSFSRGDIENGKTQGKWSLGLNVAAILTFVVLVIIIIIIEVTSN